MAESKTEQAKQLLVRYIHDKKMERGSRLPGQDFFRREFKYGTTTIGAAIRELQKDGVLDVRDKIGAYLLDPNANGYMGRTIALTAMHLGNSAFYSALSSFIQVKLMNRGCLMRLFYCEKPGVKTLCSIDDFSGLRRCIDNGEIQGVIHIDDFDKDTEGFLREMNIPAISIGGANTAAAKCGIFINQLDVMRHGAETLKSIGIKRPAVLNNRTLFKHFKNDFEAIIKKLWSNSTSSVFYSAYDAQGGRELAESFAQLPSDERPDGIIIMDDIVGGAFTSELALRLNASQLPKAVVMRNKQLNIPFSLSEILYYDVDLLKFAEEASNIIYKAMQCSIMDSGYAIFEPELNKTESTLVIN
jgi:DNA-binding LacI/PurR family transcriptional regulator